MNSVAPRVFVVQEQPKYDISHATKFGTIVIVLPPGNITYAIDHAVSRIRATLKDITENDWLLLTGDPIAIGLATHFAAATLGKVRLLKWNRRDMEYIPMKLDLSAASV